jgi:hypothetical protein
LRLSALRVYDGIVFRSRRPFVAEAEREDAFGMWIKAALAAFLVYLPLRLLAFLLHRFAGFGIPWPVHVGVIAVLTVVFVLGLYAQKEQA